MKYVETKEAPDAIGPYSQGIITGNLLFTSGQIPLDPATMEIVGSDIESQTLQVMKNLKAVFASQDVDFTHAVKTTCFLANMDDFPGFNQVYAQYFTEKPARSCVAVKTLPKNVLCEVEAIVELP